MERLLDAAAASGRHGPRDRTLLLLMYRRGLRVGAGRGIARVLSYQVAEDIAAGNLVRVLQAFEPPPWPVQLVVVSRVHMPPKVRAFLDHAAEELRKLRVIHSEG
jgi:DNA-binding transcriptional LysR family regulator